MRFFLRPITEFDIQQIRHLNELVQSSPWSLNQVLSEYEQNNPLSKVACDPEGKIVGYIFLRQSGEQLEITSLGVAISFQRQGVATTLVRNVIEQLSKKPVELFLEVNEFNSGAISFYESMGFVRTGIRPQYYKDGSAALCMKLDLAKA